MYSGIIYCAISPNGKKYYGKTVRTLSIRKNEHLRNKRNWKFSNALKKYGIDNFKWVEICKINSNLKYELTKELNEKEKYWINKDQTTLKEFGYNMTIGGDGTCGNTYNFSEEHKYKISESLKGRKLQKETKDKISKSLKGIIRSKETRKKISDSRKGIKFSEKTKKTLSNSKKGSKNPNWGKPRSAETIMKISNSNKGQKRSLETIKNISLAQKKRYGNEI
jgi:group I intron endonuclease